MRASAEPSFPFLRRFFLASLCAVSSLSVCWRSRLLDGEPEDIMAVIADAAAAAAAAIVGGAWGDGFLVAPPLVSPAKLIRGQASRARERCSDGATAAGSVIASEGKSK